MLAARFDTVETVEGCLAEINMIAFNSGHVKSFHISADEIGRDEFRRALNGATADIDRQARKAAESLAESFDVEFDGSLTGAMVLSLEISEILDKDLNIAFDMLSISSTKTNF